MGDVAEAIIAAVGERFTRDGAIEPCALVVDSDHGIQVVPIDEDPEATDFRGRVRILAEQVGARAVAVVSEARVPGSGQARVEAVVIYLETPAARREYVCPIRRDGLFPLLDPHRQVEPSIAPELSGFFCA